MLAVRCVGPLVFVLAALAPLTAYAQGSITGTVKDASGAVLPGVTVEVSSPALIEKARVTVSDDTGQYRIVDLRPGTYKATFTLTGFNTVVREGIQLVGSFTATINADMAVGAVQETVTVVGETPVVDIQNTSRQHVISDEVIDAIPAGRSHYDLAALMPGLTGIQFGRVGMAGRRRHEQSADRRHVDSRRHVHGHKVMINGLTSRNLLSSAWATNFIADTGTAAEWTIDYAAQGAEAVSSGVTLRHDSERRRQQIQRLGLRDRRERRLSVEQLHARVGGARPAAAGRACDLHVRHQSRRVAARFSGTGCGFTAPAAGRPTSSTSLARSATPTPATRKQVALGCRRRACAASSTRRRTAGASV